MVDEFQLLRTEPTHLSGTPITALALFAYRDVV